MKESERKNPNFAIYQSILVVVILIGVGLFLIILFRSTNKETEIVLNDISIEIKGLYGVTCNYTDITSVELKDSVPTIGTKKNGAAIGDVKKGFFLVDGLGKCRLFLLSNQGPYIFVQVKDSYIIMNYRDAAKTEQLYNDLTTRLAAKAQ